jgi:tetratricopeptide (TPR) repeat protein
LLIADKQFGPALEALQAVAERQPKLEAVCYQGLGQFSKAAECYRLPGNLKEALNCYRAAPDFDAALNVVCQLGDHPARESLEWMLELQDLVAKRRTSSVG